MEYALDSTNHYMLCFEKFYYTLNGATSNYHETLWLDNEKKACGF